MLFIWNWLMVKLSPMQTADGEVIVLHDDHPGIGYAFVVSFISMLTFFFVLYAVGTASACAVTALLVLLFVIDAYVPRNSRGGGPDGARRPPYLLQPSARLVRRYRTCGLTEAAIAALPKSAYYRSSAGNGEQAGGGCAQLLCAVCLDDVRDGDMVRQLAPCCTHLFHVDCIDLWLRTHRTCPICRCQLSPQKVTANAGAAPAAMAPFASELPPV